MKTTIQAIATFTATVLLTGCANTGLSNREKSTVSYANYILGLRATQARNLSVAIATPIHLAVAQVGEPAPSGEMLAKLRADPALVASVVGLPLPAEISPKNPGTEGKDQTEDFAAKVRAVCNVAASVGADYVFIYGGSLDSWHEQNSLMILDVTIIGGVTIPSTKIVCESRAAGALIQTATAEPVLFVNVDGRRSGHSPSYLAVGKTEALRAELRDEVAGSLTSELLQKLIHPK